MPWIWILGLILAYLLWYGEQPEMKEAKARARKRKRAKIAFRTKTRKKPKVETTTVTIHDGITFTIGSLEELDALEELVLIDDFEEEVLDNEGM